VRNDAYDDYAYDDRQRYCAGSNGADGVEGVHVVVRTGGKNQRGQTIAEVFKKNNYGMSVVIPAQQVCAARQAAMDWVAGTAGPLARSQPMMPARTL
jgi:hypothetical protein